MLQLATGSWPVGLGGGGGSRREDQFVIFNSRTWLCPGLWLTPPTNRIRAVHIECRRLSPPPPHACGQREARILTSSTIEPHNATRALGSLQHSFVIPPCPPQTKGLSVRLTIRGARPRTREAPRAPTPPLGGVAGAEPHEGWETALAGRRRHASNRQAAATARGSVPGGRARPAVFAHASGNSE